MPDPIIAGFTYTGLIALIGVGGWVAVGPEPKGFVQTIVRYGIGWASLVWVPVAGIVIIVRTLTI